MLIGFVGLPLRCIDITVVKNAHCCTAVGGGGGTAQVLLPTASAWGQLLLLIEIRVASTARSLGTTYGR